MATRSFEQSEWKDCLIYSLRSQCSVPFIPISFEFLDSATLFSYDIDTDIVSTVNLAVHSGASPPSPDCFTCSWIFLHSVGAMSDKGRVLLTEDSQSWTIGGYGIDVFLCEVGVITHKKG